MILGLGTVVTLKIRSNIKVCIIGFNPVVNNQKYDYSGVLYPFGMVKDGCIISFNSEQVEEVVYNGYSDHKHAVLNDFITSLNSIQKNK